MSVPDLLKCRLLSDLHLEFGSWSIPSHDDDLDTVLVLAGDIHTKGRAVLPGCHDPQNKDQTVYSWLGQYVDRFKAIVLVLGNHDYWGGCMDRMPQKIKEYVASQGWDNVHILENEAVVIEGVAFIGSTFWTDMNGGDSRARYDDEQSSNNYKKIRFKLTRKIKSQVLELRHKVSKNYIEKYCTDNPDVPKVLVTHQAPLLESWTEAHGELPPEWGDVSDCGEWIESLPGLKVICHGHLHTALDYMYRGRSVFCNPRGYAPDALTKGFDPYKSFTVCV